MRVKTYFLLEFEFIVAMLLLHITSCAGNSDSHAHRRRKRIIHGKPLPSHGIYNTHYLIEMRHTHSCISDQLTHMLDDCLFLVHKCDGSLIHPRWVLTACHCMSYSLYYDLDYERPTPGVPLVDPLDVPGYFDLKYLPIRGTIRETMSAYHPLLNSMTLWAGSPNRSQMTQKRHAASFYPHQFCLNSQSQMAKEYPEKYNHSGYSFYEFDVGLVKTCMPFVIDKNVKLAPLKPAGQLESQLSEMFKKNAVCLWIGFGLVPKLEGVWNPNGDDVPEMLQHVWRYIECSDDCNESRMRCMMCSRLHGPSFTSNSKGDSGGPIICDGFVVGIISKGHQEPERNLSIMYDFPVACVRREIHSNYLEALLGLHDEVFHWINGQPIPMTTERTTRQTP